MIRTAYICPLCRDPVIDFDEPFQEAYFRTISNGQTRLFHALCDHAISQKFREQKQSYIKVLQCMLDTTGLGTPLTRITRPMWTVGNPTRCDDSEFPGSCNKSHDLAVSHRLLSQEPQHHHVCCLYTRFLLLLILSILMNSCQ